MFFTGFLPKHSIVFSSQILHLFCEIYTYIFHILEGDVQTTKYFNDAVSSCPLETRWTAVVLVFCDLDKLTYRFCELFWHSSGDLLHRQFSESRGSFSSFQSRCFYGFSSSPCCAAQRDAPVSGVGGCAPDLAPGFWGEHSDSHHEAWG